jgi:hypothetical protein
MKAVYNRSMMHNKTDIEYYTKQSLYRPGEALSVPRG